jgi:hypothetical protein
VFLEVVAQILYLAQSLQQAAVADQLRPQVMVLMVVLVVVLLTQEQQVVETLLAHLHLKETMVVL